MGSDSIEKADASLGELLTGADAKVAQLLDLVDAYTALTRDYRLHFVDGCMTLSRANCEAGRKRYGEDAFDMRPHLSAKCIAVGEEFKLEARAPAAASACARAARAVPTKVPSVTASGVAPPPATLTNRRRPAPVLPRAPTTEVDPPVVDPIAQFGALVPPQLRQSQQHFDRWLAAAVALANLQRKMARLLADIELHP